MQTRPRISTRALVATVTATATVLGGGIATAANAEQADPLPVLGHWRNGHPGDNAEPEGWLQRMEAAEQAYGDFEGHWRNYHAPEDELPMNDQEIAAAERGERLHISWRPRPEGEDWAYTASGAYDDAIDQVMTDMRDHCGEDCWLSIDIEPEDNVDETPGSGYTSADFREMWHRVAASRERIGADNVKLVWVVQGYEQWRPLYDDLWPGNDEVDVVGHDPYIRRDESPARLTEKMVNRTRWMVNNSTPEMDLASKPLLIAEYGCDINSEAEEDARGTNQHRAECLTAVQGVMDELGDLGVVEMEFYDALWSWVNDPPAVDGQAYQALKDASEAG
jgi:hypothetical protein